MADEKPVDAVRLMREHRDRVTRELDGLTLEEQRRHIHEQIAAAPAVRPGWEGGNTRELTKHASTHDERGPRVTGALSRFSSTCAAAQVLAVWRP